MPPFYAPVRPIFQRLHRRSQRKGHGRHTVTVEAGNETDFGIFRPARWTIAFIRRAWGPVLKNCGAEVGSLPLHLEDRPCLRRSGSTSTVGLGFCAS